MSVENTLVQRAAPLLDRRALLKRLLYAGLGVTGLGALTTYNIPWQSPITINWLTNGDSWGTFKDLATYFSQINQDGITVKPTSGTDHDTLVEMFQKQRSTFDVVSLDVTWMREFITENWLTSLDEYWPINSVQPKRADYLQKPLDICSWNGQLWAAPLHTDVGILYYRTKNMKKISSEWTWEDLASTAQQVQESSWYSGGLLWEGYWVPTQPGNEGLMCTFLEILDGFGGQLFDRADDPQRVLINSDEAVNALKHMKNWNGTISAYTTEEGLKKKASNSDANDCATVWKKGYAAFMRNWPHYITDSDNAHNAVAEEYNVASLPLRVFTSADQHNTGLWSHTRSCLGGWQLAINAYSPNKNAAWQFIQWMLGPEAQQYLAYHESFTVTLRSVYNDPRINAQNPHYRLLPEIIDNAQYRPLLPNYQKEVAIPVQAIVSRVLTDNSYMPEQAVKDLEQQLENALHKK